MFMWRSCRVLKSLLRVGLHTGAISISKSFDWKGGWLIFFGIPWIGFDSWEVLTISWSHISWDILFIIFVNFHASWNCSRAVYSTTSGANNAITTHLSLRHKPWYLLSGRGGTFRWIAVYTHAESVTIQLQSMSEVPRLVGLETQAGAIFVSRSVRLPAIWNIVNRTGAGLQTYNYDIEVGRWRNEILMCCVSLVCQIVNLNHPMRTRR